jgi:hypothetical protein
MKFFLTLAILLWSLEGWSQTNYVWVGGATGVWTTSSNWSPSGVPSVQDTAFVSNAFITGAGGRSISNLSLTAESRLSHTSTFTVNDFLWLTNSSFGDSVTFGGTNWFVQGYKPNNYAQTFNFPSVPLTEQHLSCWLTNLNAANRQFFYFNGPVTLTGMTNEMLGQTTLGLQSGSSLTLSNCTYGFSVSMNNNSTLTALSSVIKAHPFPVWSSTYLYLTNSTIVGQESPSLGYNFTLKTNYCNNSTIIGRVAYNDTMQWGVSFGNPSLIQTNWAYAGGYLRSVSNTTILVAGRYASYNPQIKLNQALTLYSSLILDTFNFQTLGYTLTTPVLTNFFGTSWSNSSLYVSTLISTTGVDVGTSTIYLQNGYSNLTNYFSLVPVGYCTFTNASISITGTLAGQLGSTLDALGGTITLSIPGTIPLGAAYNVMVNGKPLFVLYGSQTNSTGVLTRPFRGGQR